MRRSGQGIAAKLLEHVHASFWLVPSIMGALSVGLALILTRPGMPQFLSNPADVDGARELLSTVASSLVTVMGVVFSVLVVVLSLAESQYGPRVLRSYLRDPVEHFTIGIFASTFVFSLLVLRALRSDGPVPDVAILVAVVLAVASVAVFVYFVHHIAKSIQAPIIVASVSRDFAKMVNSMYQGAPGSQEPGDEQAITASKKGQGDPTVIQAQRSGYVQAVDAGLLFKHAHKRRLLIEVVALPGEFVLPGEPLARVWPKKVEDEASENAVRRAVLLGDQRVLVHDVRFAVVQLVEVAMHALSPGINEPYTAVSCVHRLGETLARIAADEVPSGCRFGPDGALRLIMPIVPFKHLAKEAFEQITFSAAGQPYVLRTILEMLSRLPVSRAEDIAAAENEVARVRAAAVRNVEDAPARADIEQLAESAIRQLRLRAA